MRRLRFIRPSVGVALGFIAVLIAMSGVAVALPGSNTVTSADIKNGEVKHVDLGANAVTSGDVANSSLTGSDVANNSLTGSDVNEASLGTVPRATKADKATTADSVAGMKFSKILYHPTADDAGTTLLTYAGVTLRATCKGYVLAVTASATTAAPAFLTSQSFGYDSEPQNSVDYDNFTTTPVSVFADGESQTLQRGTTQIGTANGHLISITWSSDTDNVTYGAGGPGAHCLFMGLATLA